MHGMHALIWRLSFCNTFFYELANLPLTQNAQILHVLISQARKYPQISGGSRTGAPRKAAAEQAGRVQGGLYRAVSTTRAMRGFVSKEL